MFRSGFARCPLDGTPLQELVSDPLAGSVFADRYVIERFIGEGAAGRVYRARHKRVSRRFAIKVLFGDFATDPKMRKRFEQEAESASRLNHPNVVSVVDFGETEDGLLYLVMDYVEGRELADVLWEEAPLEPARVVRLLRGLATGLDHAHKKGLIHRDFKGENVILEGSGDNETPRIVDFGIAVLGDATGNERLTAEGVVVGTPAFMSPEQASGLEVDQRSDLFSLGVLLYEMLTGALPFEGTPIAMARQNVTHDPPPMCERVPGLEVPDELEALTRKLMARERDERFASAAEVLDAIDGALRTTGRSVRDAFGATESLPADVLAPAPVAQKEEPVAAESVEPSAPSAPPPTELAPPPAEVVEAVGSPSTGTAIARPGARRSGALAIAAVAILLGVVGLYGVYSVGAGDAEAEQGAPLPEPAKPQLAPPKADNATTPNAGVTPVAGTPAPTQPETRPATKPETKPETKPATKPARPVDPPAKRRVPEGRADPPAPRVERTLSQRYKRVGEMIEDLSKRKGAAAAQPLRDQYRHLPDLPSAMRNEALGRKMDRGLRRIESRLRTTSE